MWAAIVGASMILAGVFGIQENTVGRRFTGKRNSAIRRKFIGNRILHEREGSQKGIFLRTLYFFNFLYLKTENNGIS